jgi:hypothetical protein
MVTLDCPWCAAGVPVDPDALDDPIQCERCGIDLSLAPEVDPLGGSIALLDAA